MKKSGCTASMRNAICGIDPLFSDRGNYSLPIFGHLWCSIPGWWFQTWILFSISYLGCHPSHSRTSSFFKMVIAPPTSVALAFPGQKWGRLPYPTGGVCRVERWVVELHAFGGRVSWLGAGVKQVQMGRPNMEVSSGKKMWDQWMFIGETMGKMDWGKNYGIQGGILVGIWEEAFDRQVILREKIWLSCMGICVVI